MGDGMVPLDEAPAAPLRVNLLEALLFVSLEKHR